MDVHDFDFDLPPELIAQEPPPDRGAARLLFLDRDSGSLTHTAVAALPDLLRAGDLLVVNDTRVFPARLLGRRVPSGGAVECLLIGPDSVPEPVTMRVGASDRQLWEALVHPGQKLKPGARVVFEGIHTLHGEVLERRFFGRRRRAPLDRGRTPRRRRRRCDRPRPAAAVHQARRPRGRPRSLPDGLRARARIDRGANRRPALHPIPDRGPDARAASRRPRLPSTSATAPFSRCASTASRIIGSKPERYDIERGGRGGHHPRARRTAAASSRSARRRRGRSRRSRSRTTATSWRGTARPICSSIPDSRSASSTAC